MVIKIVVLVAVSTFRIFFQRKNILRKYFIIFEERAKNAVAN